MSLKGGESSVPLYMKRIGSIKEPRSDFIRKTHSGVHFCFIESLGKIKEIGLVTRLLIHSRSKNRHREILTA